MQRQSVLASTRTIGQPLGLEMGKRHRLFPGGVSVRGLPNFCRLGGVLHLLAAGRDKHDCDSEGRCVAEEAVHGAMTCKTYLQASELIKAARWGARNLQGTRTRTVDLLGRLDETIRVVHMMY